ncbi:MAG: TfoX/Sxy family protein [Fuerstiella sp.]
MTSGANHRLYVNLSASQTRKRLKGHGFGVKRVETAGRHQAAIVHTATGGHLQQLKSLFSDAMPSASITDLGIPIENLKNLGPTSARWLRGIGVQTRADLERLGPVAAYRMVKQREPGTSLNLLWAMAAALTDQDCRELSEATKEQLRQQADGA